MREGGRKKTDGVKVRPSQNMPLWYIDYFELQLFEKQ